MITSFVGRRVPAATLRVRKEPLRLPLILMIPWWLLKLLVRLLLRVAGSPVAVTTLTALTVTWAVCQLADPLVAVSGTAEPTTPSWSTDVRFGQSSRPEQ